MEFLDATEGLKGFWYSLCFFGSETAVAFHQNTLFWQNSKQVEWQFTFTKIKPLLTRSGVIADTGG